MSEKLWVKAIGYLVAIAAIGATYYLAQTAINAHRTSLPVKAYLDCIQKVSSFDWDQFPGEKPSASEVCKHLTTRENL